MKSIGALIVMTAISSVPAEAKSIPYTTATTTYRTLQVDGVDVFFREAGPKDAPIIVLLHGYPSSSRMWDSLIPLLADRYHLIAPDYPGFGQSAAPTPERYNYTFDHLAETMGVLLNRLGVQHYTLFMQDYGGPVGFRMAMAAPERVQAFIVQNANAYQEGLGAKWANIARYWSDPAAHPEQVDAFVGYEGTKQRHLGTSPYPERYNPDAWDDEFARLSRPGQREIQARLLYDYRTNVASYPLWQAWLRDHKPRTLVLWGRYDPSFIVPGAEGYRRDLPNAEMHILDAGHFALDEKAEEIAGLVRGFMAKAVPVAEASGDATMPK
jgi:pimeloyl-ACP methyl ester carboxylesterase